MMLGVSDLPEDIEKVIEITQHAGPLCDVIPIVAIKLLSLAKGLGFDLSENIVREDEPVTRARMVAFEKVGGEYKIKYKLSKEVWGNR